MKLSIHNHELTPANTGKTMHVRKSGRIVDVEYCKQCRRDSAARYAATHKRKSRGKNKSTAKAEEFKKPLLAPRLICRRGCRAVSQTPEGRAEHERRFHVTLW